ncbi:TonB family protein [Campylobacter devanensis]|uniref:Energy transduction protein TonB n=1 Tax=Campylobacter devanensis TaxID=3161138 RepID=A0A1X9SQZ6_9BACT|nr:energy transducer TonB [Campylobacter lanienae]ARQ98666.1 putative energy transduction protein TonB [Campylobacter lanienae]SUX01721.1 TonB family protein [Campylobacter lanienae]
MEQKALNITSFIFSLLIYFVLVVLITFGAKINLGKDKIVSEFEIYIVESDIKPNSLNPIKPPNSSINPSNSSINSPSTPDPQTRKIPAQKSQKPTQKIQTTTQNLTRAAYQSSQQNTPINSPSKSNEPTPSQNQITKLSSDSEIFKRLKDEIAQNTIYPRAARRARLSGVVGVEFQIDKSGISNEKISRPSQHKLLNEAALNAIKKTKPNLENIDKKYSIFMEIAFELR